MIFRTALLLALLSPLLSFGQVNVDGRQGASAAAGARSLSGLFGKSPCERFRQAIAKAQAVQIFEGLPDPSSDPAAFALERKRTDLLIVGTSGFYASPLAIEPADKAVIEAMFREGRAFSPGGDDSVCGKFHPSFLLLWKIDGVTWSAKLGMGCQEVLAEGPGLAMNRYILPSSYSQLDKILGKYQSRRGSASRSEGQKISGHFHGGRTAFVQCDVRWSRAL
ncbi:MAG: hypothetical protein ACOYNN_11320 [Terrimicrobiaceae bacterium]|jgi:hypothetical protein